MYSFVLLKTDCCTPFVCQAWRNAAPGPWRHKTPLVTKHNRKHGTKVQGSPDPWTEETEPCPGRPPVAPDNTALEGSNGQGSPRYGEAEGTWVQETDSQVEWRKARGTGREPGAVSRRQGEENMPGTCCLGEQLQGFPPVFMKYFQLAEKLSELDSWQKRTHHKNPAHNNRVKPTLHRLPIGFTSAPSPFHPYTHLASDGFHSEISVCPP